MRDINIYIYKLSSNDVQASIKLETFISDTLSTVNHTVNENSTFGETLN